MSLWSGLKSNDDTSYINTEINKYQTEGNSVALLFGNSTNKPIWGYGGQNNEDSKLIFQEIIKQFKIYNTNKAEFFISKNYSWAVKYLGYALNLLLNNDKNVSLTIATVSNDKNNQINDYDIIQTIIKNSYPTLSWNILPGNFISTNSEVKNIEDSIVYSFSSFSKVYNTLENNKNDAKTFFSISPTIGNSYKGFIDIKSNNNELCDLKSANKVLKWGIANDFTNWGMLSLTRDYPGTSSSTASGITNQKSGDFAKTFELNLYPYLQNNIIGSFKIENNYATQKGLNITWDKNNTLKNVVIYDIYKDGKIIDSTLYDSYSYIFNDIPKTNSVFNVVAKNLGETRATSNYLDIKFNTMTKNNLLTYPVVKFKNETPYNTGHLIAYKGVVYKLDCWYIFGIGWNPINVYNGIVTKLCNVSDLVTKWNYSSDAANALNG